MAYTDIDIDTLVIFKWVIHWQWKKIQWGKFSGMEQVPVAGDRAELLNKTLQTRASDLVSFSGFLLALLTIWL